MAESFFEQQNVLGLVLETCCQEPVTGFFRDGFCHTHPDDQGGHTVCAHMTDEFLQYSLSKGNDLITPWEEWGFPGLKAGDRWCLCAARWIEAYEANAAPPVYIRATHINTLKMIELAVLKQHAIDLC
ncbi:DUF2237 family protein [Endozoicomonas sp. SCSIO W0465]|uniref:DUF2237 family protein n=1 Tax=Endozoicomonas sp. SCSIO W0465 TaxID=2918516 RepID=UPI002076267D|nr:DUF2237 domain-containing protein [Endozoicomonas sp. SCSIO W0465]USE38750.1 DUF2237 domain-containing protein [Endozoicomonas sp. SCSIO W0465]